MQNPQTIANSFNDYFLSIAEDLLKAKPNWKYESGNKYITFI
jgi:hypothetical protein